MPGLDQVHPFILDVGCREFPDKEWYVTPVFFQSDWLNEFLAEQSWEIDKENDDYKFLYIGPKNSW